MKRWSHGWMRFWIRIGLPLLGLVGTVLAAPVRVGRPPETRREEVREVLHGVEVVDPYRWLEDGQSPETRAWIEAQNAYTRSLLDALPGREALRRRVAQFLRVDTVGIPVVRGGRYFFLKRRADQDQPVLYMREGPTGPDRVLIDPHEMDPQHLTSVSLLEVSEDGRLLAYGIRHGGEDEVIVRWRDVDTGRDLSDELPKGRYFGIALLPDRSGFYYAKHTPEGPRVYYHAVGSAPSSDVEVFGRDYGPDKIIGVDLSHDGRYLLLTVFYGAGAQRTELYYAELASGTGARTSWEGESRPSPPTGPVAPEAIRPLVRDVPARFVGEVGGSTLFVWTNWKAPRGRILAVDLTDPGPPDTWREVIPERDGVLTGFTLAGGRLLVQYLENVVARVRVFEPDGRIVREIAFPTLGTITGLQGRWDRREAFFVFTSFLIPPRIYRYDVATGRQTLWAAVRVPIRADRYVVRQVWYTSKDGTRVPMFLVHSRDLRRNGQNPTLLTGYGGFNVSLTPAYSAMAALWVRTGGVFALANLRGGGEFGEAWHEAGMRDKKQNVFDDFIAAAEWLIREGYTRPERLAITGRSNGGLLVGAALTQRPDLFRAVVCGYPLLDMVRYHRFLVARYWVSEYGSSDDPEQFKYLLAYSPYHNVKPGTHYPAVLFVTGDADTRVDPLHARKMTALLQWANASDRPILLRYDTKAGHVGALPVRQQIEDLTDELLFLLWQLDVPVGGREGQ
jgi:prolyl oligopeptidase